MARFLIIGCGCRGRALARELVRAGHSVRGTTRRANLMGEIESVGAEAVIADPGRVGTLAPSLDQVTVTCLLLGSATGSNEQLSALHGARLEMLLQRMIDTTVRAVIYEVVGTVDDVVLRRGEALVRSWCERSRIPYALLDADASSHAQWTGSALATLERVIAK